MLRIFSETNFSKIIIILAFFALSACDASKVHSGYIPDQGLISDLKVGETTRAEAINHLGRPIDIASVGSDDIYYLYQVSIFGGPIPELESERQLLVLRFNKNQVLSKIERKTKKDGRSLYVKRDVTETPGITRPGFFTDFFSGIGKFVEDE